jgi:hypothetical protein
MDSKSFARNFRGQPVPPELAKLFAFDQQHQSFFSECFEFCDFSPDELSNWSEDSEFLARLIPFAKATGGGSVYALWLHRDGLDLSQAPVVVFGDEGGMHVVAKSLVALLQLLTYDVEPMIDWEGVSFYKSDDHEPSDRAEEYATWLKSEFGLSPASDADGLVAAAHAEHKAAFDLWVKRFVKR